MDRKHTFIPYANPEKNTCVRCGRAANHTIHHQLTKDESPIEEIGRTPRDEMFMLMLDIIRRRSTCRRAQVAALIVRDGRVVSMGYNGSPPGMPHCIDVGCEPEDGCERTIHAEANAIAWAARAGVSTQGAAMYCTHGPCRQCAQLIVSCGIVEFHWSVEYRLQRIDILNEAKLKTVDYQGLFVS